MYAAAIVRVFLNITGWHVDAAKRTFVARHRKARNSLFMDDP
jgi:hypothetical protein